MSIQKFYFLAFIWIFLVACGTKDLPGDHSVAKWPHAVSYEIFVQSFYDSNGDSIGDFNGLASKLDYLQDLGIKGIWLMPINPSPTYHKYDVTDYKDVHPDYGTLEDFKNLVSQAHERDIKIVIDLVINHSGYDHPWFVSSRSGKDSPYRDYYVWANRDSIAEQVAKKEMTLDSDNLTQWHAVDGKLDEKHYYGFFWGGMPDLNFDNKIVREEIYEIGRFWLEDVGVDGFRLDAAKHIFPDERAEDNHAFWVEFRERMEAIKPDVYLVGEVWSDAETVAPYLKGLSALFNFDIGYAIHHVVSAGKDTLNLVATYKEINDIYQNVTDDFVDATFLKNHDQNRILSEMGGDQAKARVAASILLTLPGSPYLYYGEEIGMLGKKPDQYIREPFIWEAEGSDPGQPKWITPRYSTSEKVSPLNQQKNDRHSIFNFYKDLIHIRNTSEVLTFGGITGSGILNDALISFIRNYEKDALLVIHNISGQGQRIKLSGELKDFDKIYFSTHSKNQVDKDEVFLAPYATIILR